MGDVGNTGALGQPEKYWSHYSCGGLGEGL